MDREPDYQSPPEINCKILKFSQPVFSQVFGSIYILVIPSFQPADSETQPLDSEMICLSPEAPAQRLSGKPTTPCETQLWSPEMLPCP